MATEINLAVSLNCPVASGHCCTDCFGSAGLLGDASAYKRLTIGEKQGNAVWVWENSTATILDNSIDGYWAAAKAIKATVIVAGKTSTTFQGTAIIVWASRKSAHVYGNTAISPSLRETAVDVKGPSGIVEQNLLK